MTRKIVALIALTMVLGTLPNTTYELNTITEKIMEASSRDSWTEGEWLHQFPTDCGLDFNNDDDVCDTTGVDFVVNSTGVTHAFYVVYKDDGSVAGTPYWANNFGGTWQETALQPLWADSYAYAEQISATVSSNDTIYVIINAWAEYSLFEINTTMFEDGQGGWYAETLWQTPSDGHQSLFDLDLYLTSDEELMLVSVSDRDHPSYPGPCCVSMFTSVQELSRHWELNKEYGTSADADVNFTVLNLDYKTQMSAGKKHVCAVQSGNDSLHSGLLCWGDNSKGQLGVADYLSINGDETSLLGYEVSIPSSNAGYSTTFFTAVTAGEYHTCGITNTGDVYCWGDGDYGQIGNGDFVDSDVPYHVPLPSNLKAVSVAAAKEGSCAVMEDSSVYCWGSTDSNGQASTFNQAPFTPHQIPNFEAIRIVGGWASEDFCAVHADFSFSCWGANVGGKLNSDETAKHTPVLMESGLPITDLSIGFDFMCFTESLPNSKWETVCQGAGQFGQLGSEDRPTTWSSVTHDTAATDPAEPARIYSGFADSCVANHAESGMTGHDAVCWGPNAMKQHGHQENTDGRDVATGTEAKSIYHASSEWDVQNGITTIAMGDEITCFMFSNSSVGCSGYLWEGSNQINGISVVNQLNDMTDTNSARPASLGPFTHTPYHPSFDIDHIRYDSSDNYDESASTSGIQYAGLSNTNNYDSDSDLIIIGATWYGDSHQGSTMIASNGMVHKQFDGNTVGDCWAGGTLYVGLHSMTNEKFKSVWLDDGDLYYESSTDPCYDESETGVDTMTVQLTDGETINWKHISYDFDSNGDLHLLYGESFWNENLDQEEVYRYKKFTETSLIANSQGSVANSPDSEMSLTGEHSWIIWGQNNQIQIIDDEFYLVGSFDDGIKFFSTNDGTTSIEDDDGDGVANDVDLCPNTAVGASVDQDGCSFGQSSDDDNDGVDNLLDNCPNTPSGETVDTYGCSDSQKDDDGDGVTNNIDLCPSTPSGETVSTDGCSTSQLDVDGDGVSDADDLCPNTQQGWIWIDVDGCSWYESDIDGDGVANGIDLCPFTAANSVVETDGCSDSQVDSDGDSVSDSDDLCPNTPQGWLWISSDGCSEAQQDSDGDGVSDLLDQCPSTPANTAVGIDGCNVPPVCNLYINDSSGANEIIQSVFDLSSSQTESDISLPIGDYLFTVTCIDPEDQSIDMIVTIGTNSPQTFSGNPLTTGPILIPIVDGGLIERTIAYSWDDGTNSGTNSVVITITEDLVVDSPGFTSALALMSIIVAGLVVSKRLEREQN
ncbi:MAG: thrombospondin type 3 repeat-containing protein [Candidatus Poseidonia sp.]|nr:thrombospondin type 3 repeat-containing protein [Poseidonia sp.]